jgi:hypothetical protein
MRAFIRKIVTALWLLLAIVVGTVFRQNIEEFANEQGWDALLSGWLSGMINLSLSSAVLGVFLVLTGAVITLWSDAWIRNYVASKKQKYTRRCHLIFDPQTGLTEFVKGKEDNGFAGYALTPTDRAHKMDAGIADPKVSDVGAVFTLIYEDEVDHPRFSVSASHEIIYRVTCNAKKFCHIDIDWCGATEPVELHVYVYDKELFGGIEDLFPHWEEASINRESETAPLPTQQGTAIETKP